MKVKELIAKLQEFDGELEVCSRININIQDDNLSKKLSIVEVIYNEGFISNRPHELLLITK
jgi:hypothetical protein